MVNHASLTSKALDQFRTSGLCENGMNYQAPRNKLTMKLMNLKVQGALSKIPAAASVVFSPNFILI